ncbi:N-acetyl-gamma-glutamyl-phosphate reductase [Peribacillus alkalitolerans]|uniref:N-acetyl-gamma-glutamyl-phosphate reductase n=1 Tax=Peribacillus alkalitolerans TaxID=1550385 RepID=UPI0013D62622|nr:N-acetyl-gamma-glutamyl-phosphate reductase [Peribacillus alkalitolerans]
MKAAIIGATGYSGLELVRLIQNHPFFSIGSLNTSSSPGTSINEGYPHLANIEYILQDIQPEKIAKESDLVFLATPSGVSSQLTPIFMELGLKVIDLSGDLRLKDSDQYTRWYKKTPVSNHVLEEAVYGLTEWNKEQIAKAKILANPGCYPTATLLGLAPLLKEGWTDGEDLIIDAKSGASGAGRTAQTSTLYSEINENMKIYKVHEHQHIPEIEQQIKSWLPGASSIDFSTHLVPMTRGIMSTMYVKANQDITTKQLIELYQETYINCPFIRIGRETIFPCTKQVYGSNYCDIGIALNERTNRITIVSVIDNLLKGAAGQAVQNANVMYGLSETEGLKHMPLFP